MGGRRIDPINRSPMYWMRDGPDRLRQTGGRLMSGNPLAASCHLDAGRRGLDGRLRGRRSRRCQQEYKEGQRDQRPDPVGEQISLGSHETLLLALDGRMDRAHGPAG